MKEYTILLNGEFFTTFKTRKTDELEILEKLFRDNDSDFEYSDIDENGKAYIETWQGVFTVE